MTVLKLPRPPLASGCSDAGELACFQLPEDVFVVSGEVGLGVVAFGRLDIVNSTAVPDLAMCWQWILFRLPKQIFKRSFAFFFADAVDDVW